MRERARHVGASFVIWGGKDAGIEIEVSVPAGVAYAPLKPRAAVGFENYRRRIRRVVNF
jgi:hypothetical protein